MKVKELIEILEKLNPDREVVLSSDEEGNRFNTLFDVGIGDWWDEENDFIQDDPDYLAELIADDTPLVGAVCLWP